MAQSNIKATLPCDIKKVWDVVTNLQECSWRSDLKRIEILNEKQFIEYTKEGYATDFTITEMKPYERWEFDMENANMKGHWTGIFYKHGDKTTIDFTEDVTAKKFYMKPFVGKFLRQQQALYFTDLKKKLGCADSEANKIVSKKEMVFYHVVTDKPMQVGQRIIFDEEHHNGVWKRVHDKTEIVSDIYENPEKYDGCELEHHTSVALRELAMEEVRQEKYPGYPSRMGCLYVSNTLEEAQKWAQLFVQWGRPTYHIVKLKADGRYFSGNANNCFDGCLNKKENLLLAEHYWENRPDMNGEEPITEILVDGDIEVIEIVEEINLNKNK